MGVEAIGQNLRRLRGTRRLTQVELAEAAGLSRPGYRAIETGESVPRADTLQALADALDVGVGELLQPVRRLERVRFRSSARMRSRQQVLADVARWLDDFIQLEEALDARLESRLPGIQERLSAEEADAKRAAEIVREAFSLDDDPIRDICGLLESNGVKVMAAAVATGNFFGLSVSPDDGGPAIVVNTWDRISVERWIFTAAHELGHLLLHLDAYDVDQTAEVDAQEQEANVFAGHFLMPDDLFRREWDDTYGMALWDRVLKVKRMFGVSYRTVLYRLAESTDIGNRIWPMFQIESKKRTGKTLLEEDEPERLATDAFRASFPESHRAGEPGRLSPIDFQEDRLPTLVRRAVERNVITLARGAEILGLSLKGMRELAASWAG